MSQDGPVCLSACVFPCPMVQEGAGNGPSQCEHRTALALLSPPCKLCCGPTGARQAWCSARTGDAGLLSGCSTTWLP